MGMAQEHSPLPQLCCSPSLFLTPELIFPTSPPAPNPPPIKSRVGSLRRETGAWKVEDETDPQEKLCLFHPEPLLCGSQLGGGGALGVLRMCGHWGRLPAARSGEVGSETHPGSES